MSLEMLKLYFLQQYLRYGDLKQAPCPYSLLVCYYFYLNLSRETGKH